MKIVPYTELPITDLLIDAVYEGAPGGQLSGEALSKLLPGTGNQGGFRASGRGEDKKFVVLYTSGEDKDWPDRLDPNTGQFVYYGDNKKPGHELHDTARDGNKILRRSFDLLHATPSNRQLIAPFLIFQKFPTAESTRSVQFKGLAVPGFTGLPATADLVAVWKSSEGQRFQNYQATFTVLDTPLISRAWLDDLAGGENLTVNAPDAWREWVELGRYQALTAESTTEIRSVDEQVPDTPSKKVILQVVWDHFKDAPLKFEAFAAHVFQMHDPRVIIDEVTRASVDGGRDAVGRYLLGLTDDPVYAEFSLEAKCYRPPLNGAKPVTIGVKEVARLISRIRHREFGVLVTTSVVSRQAYEEVREDRHPIIFLSGKDIADILISSGFNSPELVKDKLELEFEIPRGSK